MTIDSKASLATLSISRIYRLSISEMLVRVGLRACSLRGEVCMYIFFLNERARDSAYFIEREEFLQPV